MKIKFQKKEKRFKDFKNFNVRNNFFEKVVPIKKILDLN